MGTKGVSLDNILMDNSHKSGRDENTVNEVLQELEQKKLKQLNVAPERDVDVIKVLHLLEEPSKLANETVEQRRERLALLLFANRDYLKKYFESGLQSSIGNTVEDNEKEDDKSDENEDEEFYTPAIRELNVARRHIIKDSINRARKRIKLERSRTKNVKVPEQVKERRNLVKELQNFELAGTQVLSTRPISKILFSTSDQFFATGSWGGDISVVKTENLEPIATSNDSTRGKICGLDWNIDNSLLISGGEDSYIKLHNFNEPTKELSEMRTFKGHEGRVVNVKFHPTGKYLASASFDTTWRLWDVETGTELLLQEGHAKEVYSLSFQKDGSLLCTGGMDNVGLIWDIRSGKSIMQLNGHTRPIYAIDWSPNSYQVATGGGDGIINIWDIRNITKANQILAHKNIVSDLSFSKGANPCLISSSYDKLINLYSVDNWLKIKTLEGHTDKILSVDISTDNNCILSSGWDRSVKLWEKDISSM